MKKIIGIAVLLVIGFSGCKKAKDAPAVPTYYCKNTCYLCYDKNDYSDTHSYCNTDYSEAQLQERMFDDSILGFICKEIQPTIFHEVTGENNPQIDSHQANRLHCYNKEQFHPQYFNYDSFYAASVERNARCTKCYDSIAARYIEIYMDTLERFYGPLENCPECATYEFCVEIAMPYAAARVNAMGMHCGITSGPYFSMPTYMVAYLRRLQYEPVSPTFTQEEKDSIIRLNSWLDFNPRAQEGINYAAIFRECP